MPWLSCFPPPLVALLCPSLRLPPAPSVSVAPFLPVLPTVQPPGGPLPRAKFPRCCPRPGGPDRAGGTALASAGFLVPAGSGSWGGHHSNNHRPSAPCGADQAAIPKGQSGVASGGTHMLFGPAGGKPTSPLEERREPGQEVPSRWGDSAGQQEETLGTTDVGGAGLPLDPPAWSSAPCLGPSRMCFQRSPRGSVCGDA